MAERPVLPAAILHDQNFPGVLAHDSYVHQGDVYYVQAPVAVPREPEPIAHYGLCLSLAPLIDPSSSVGRAEEVDTMKEMLDPGRLSTTQRRLVLGGISGVGKTQLVLAYAQRY